MRLLLSTAIAFAIAALIWASYDAGVRKGRFDARFELQGR